MNRNTVSFFAAVLLSTACLAQSSADTQGASPAAAKASVSLPAGTTLEIELIKAVDAKKAKPGDEVVAKVTRDVKSDDKVVLAKGSKVMGKVTQAQGRAKGQDESELGLAFDSAVLKDGTQAPISVAIQAVANSSAAMAQAALDAQGASTAISTSQNGGSARPGEGPAGRPGLGSQAQGAAGADLHASNAASTDHVGALTSSSEGVIGLPGYTLASGTLITSSTNNVRLERETRFLLRVNSQ